MRLSVITVYTLTAFRRLEVHGRDGIHASTASVGPVEPVSERSERTGATGLEILESADSAALNRSVSVYHC